jgi:hypothetical protein
MKTLYETDYYQWIQQQVKLLELRDFDKLDLENLKEELESLGKSDRRKLRSLLERLLDHLLKRRYVTGMSECFRGWEIEIRNFRLEIDVLLKDSPSLKNYLKEILPQTYERAIATVSEDYAIYDFTGGLDISDLDSILDVKTELWKR